MASDRKPPRFQIQTKKNGDVVVAKVDGRIGEMECDELKKFLLDIIEGKSHKLILDIAGLSYINSTGLGVLISAERRVKESNGFVKLVSPQPFIAEIFETTRLDTIFAIHDSLEQALEERPTQ